MISEFFRRWPAVCAVLGLALFSVLVLLILAMFGPGGILVSGFVLMLGLAALSDWQDRK